MSLWRVKRTGKVFVLPYGCFPLELGSCEEITGGWEHE